MKISLKEQISKQQHLPFSWDFTRDVQVLIPAPRKYHPPVDLFILGASIHGRNSVLEGIHGHRCHQRPGLLWGSMTEETFRLFKTWSWWCARDETYLKIKPKIQDGHRTEQLCGFYPRLTRDGWFFIPSLIAGLLLDLPTLEHTVIFQTYFKKQRLHVNVWNAHQVAHHDCCLVFQCLSC